MQKIDLHVHTVSTISDHAFEFSISKLLEYIDTCKLSCIAITNHNLFDYEQYKSICKALHIVVFPGIEVDIEKGHLLVISDNTEIEDFDLKCHEITKQIKKNTDYISFNDFQNIFPDLTRYILIPHYDKDPKLSNETISLFGDNITAGEVSGPKKFIYCIKNVSSLVPVLFSDIRVDASLNQFPVRQTYVDIGEISFCALKHALRDKNKVFMSQSEGHSFFEVLQDGLRLSTGLNVILGERSTGKTYTLNHIFENFENVKYIRQFQLLERDEEADSQRFNNVISQKQSLFTQGYLKEFKNVVDDLSDVNIEDNNRDLDTYIKSLLKNAKESERADAYSKAKLFNEVVYAENELEPLTKLINAVSIMTNNTEYKKIINKYITTEALHKLIIELIINYRNEYEINLKRRWINDLVNTIKNLLQVHTASTRIKDVDFYKILIDKQRINKFCRIVKFLKHEKTITNSSVQGFQVIASTRVFKNATEMKNLSGRKMSFSEAFQAYSDPYDFLKKLRQIDGLEEVDYFKYFVNVDYSVLNKYGYPVSGGERSEFRLLQEISEALQYNMLLIDEPESSFDNLFLKNEVNKLIKDISKSMPVVLVTHNNTVGASIGPNYILYTRKTITAEQKVIYEVFSGYPTDKNLVSIDGRKLKNFNVVLDCLEAGEDAYKERGESYEILQN
jgi:hypothetical protein